MARNANSSKGAGRRITRRQFLQIFSSFIVVSLVMGILSAGLFIPVVGAAGAVVKSGPASFDELPAELEMIPPAEESVMLDGDGNEMARFYDSRRVVVDSDQISEIMKESIVAVEDKRFYEHPGIDPEGMVGALVSNLSGSKNTRGASTITQQFVKNMLIERGVQEMDQDQIDAAQAQTTARKLGEARLALALETNMSKDEILTGYLNIAPFGPNVYGAEAAAQAYFSTSAKDLNYQQSAVLAGLVQSPVELDPLTHPEAAQERRDLVLELMSNQGVISEEEREAATKVPIGDLLHPQTRIEGCLGAPGNMGYFCEYARNAFLKDDAFGDNASERKHLLENGGLTIKTTINPKIEQDAYEAVTWRVPVNDPSGVDAAIVSVEPGTGKIISMAQNTEFGVTTDANPRATEVNRTVYREYGGGNGFQPGSTFKLFSLVQWLKEGRSGYAVVGGRAVFGPGSFRCNGEYVGGTWTVSDVGAKEGKTHTVHDVIVQSVNQGIADMGSRMDICDVYQTAADLGAVTVEGKPVQGFPSALIGGGDGISPLAMATAYATVANDGVKCEPMAITEVIDRDGNVVKTYEPDCTRVITEDVARQASGVLQDTANSYPTRMSRPSAAKTGTTEYNDNLWTLGYTPQLATAAWAGYADSSSKSLRGQYIGGQYWGDLFGVSFTIPMWTRYMDNASAGMPVESLSRSSVGTPPAPRVAPNTTQNPATGGQTPFTGGAGQGAAGPNDGDDD